MHEGGEDRQRGGDQAAAAAPAGGHQRDPVAPAEPKLVAGEPGQGRGLAHSAATKVRKVSSRLAAVLPVLWCNSSSVPSAIRRPPAMTPIRSAMRSATSRICVVMI